MSGLEFGQTAVPVENFLLELPEGRRIECSVDAQRVTGELEMRCQLRPFVRAQDCQTDFAIRGRRPARRCHRV